MKAALISPNEAVQNYNWVSDGKGHYVQEWYDIPNSERVAEVTTQPFDVAPPLFWISCDDTVVADQWYYDKATEQFVQIVYPPYPANEVQQIANGGPAIVA